MRETIRLAERGLDAGRGGPFAAIIVKDGKIIGRGSNLVTSTNDPTAHAEIVAIRAACRRSRNFDLTGCAIYSNCEPCPMCLCAIYWARIGSIYYANTRTDAAAIGFADAEFYKELALPIAKRKIPMQQLLRSEALAAFTAWRSNPNRIQY
jgi:guanine deaminase